MNEEKWKKNLLDLADEIFREGWEEHDRHFAVEIRDAYKDGYNKALEGFKGVCKEVSPPFIQANNKKGRWIPLPLSTSHPIYQCSYCHGTALVEKTGGFPTLQFKAILTDFCPYCGADLRETEE